MARRSRPLSHPLATVGLVIALLALPVAGCSRKETPPPEPAVSASEAPAPAAVDASFDLAFLDAMTEHHRQAIELAKTARPKLRERELQTIADSIPVARQADIDRMRTWRDQWFAGAPATTAPTPADPAELATMAAGAAYDALFARALTTHHEAGIEMAEEALPRLRHKPLKRLARQFMRALRPEVVILRAHV